MNNKKKILTIEDLVRFFEDKRLQTFSSVNTGYKLAVQVPAELKFEEYDDLTDEEMMYVTVKVMHDGINRNNSMISTENLMKAAPSIKYRPILANFKEIKDENGESIKDFTSHDFIVDSDGTIIYQEKQVGCFTADEPYLIYDKEKDRNFLMARAAIPIAYTETASIIERKNGTKVSVELSISDCAFSGKEKCLELKTFYISGCTLLAEDVAEGMYGARLDIESIAEFSESNNSVFSQKINQETNNKLIETLEALNNTLSKFNINQEDLKSSEIYGKEEPKSMNDEIKVEEEVTEVETVEETPEKVVEVTEVAEIIEETTEEIENEVTKTEEFTDEVAESETDETVEEDTPEVGENVEVIEENKEVEDTDVENYSSIVKYSVESKGEVRIYEVSLDEKIYAIQDLVNITYGESDNTYYGVKVYEDYVVMLDYWSGRAYKQSYSEEADNYTLTGDRVEVYSVWVTKEEEKALEEMKSNYSLLEQFKLDTENAQLHSQRESIIYNEKYSVLAEKDENNEYKNEAYAKLVSEMDNYSLADLEKELKSVFADYITSGGQFAYAGEPEEKTIVSKKIFASSNDKKPSRYGNLFSK